MIDDIDEALARIAALEQELAIEKEARLQAEALAELRRPLFAERAADEQRAFDTGVSDAVANADARPPDGARLRWHYVEGYQTGIAERGAGGKQGPKAVVEPMWRLVKKPGRFELQRNGHEGWATIFEGGASATLNHVRALAIDERALMQRHMQAYEELDFMLGELDGHV